MKKILFTTTALVAGAMVSSAAMADGMASTRYSSSMKSSSMSSANQLQSARYLQQNDMMGASAFTATVGGYANWMIGFVDNDKKDESLGGDLLASNEFDVMGDAEVHFDFAANLKNGMKIGAKSQLVTDTTSEAGEIDQAYMYMESKYGKVMVGRHDNVNEQLSFHAIDLGALDIQETELTNWVINPANILINQLGGNIEAALTEMTTTNLAGDEDLTKISYISPVFSGFQAGLTYAPRGEEFKDNVVRSETAADSTIMTVAYNGKVDGVGYGVSAGYGFYSMVSDTILPDTITKWNIGGRIAYQNFTVSAAYKNADLGDGLVGSDLTAWDLGVTYETGPYGVSLSYITSEIEANITKAGGEFSTLLLSGVYNMAAGVDAFATIGYGDYSIEIIGTDNPANDGFVVIGGMMLSF